MEVAATAIGVLGLAGLYTTCVHMLDTLSAAARYGIDRELLQTKIEVERVRLMIWGEAVGLNEINLDPSKTEVTEDELAVLDESLQTAALLTAVAGLLTCFVRTFEDVEFQNRTASAQKQASPLTKARWVVADEPKFRDLLTQLKAINDSLTALLPAVRKKTHVKMRDEIMRSNDAHQLQNLVNAADDIADLISETASLRLEMLSTGGHRIPAKPRYGLYRTQSWTWPRTSLKSTLKLTPSEDWTEKRGFEQVRQLVGPSEYTWLDPEEGFKIRHQISDLLADMSNSPVPSFEGTGCIGIIACETANPRGNFNFVDVLVQLVEAREVTLRIASDKRRWYGGITDRIVYDMIVAELWGQNMELKDNGMFEAHRTIKERQLDGIIKFAEEMEWPYVDEMRDTVTKLLGPKADELQIHIRAFDWASGLVLPGGPFSMAILGMLYSLSTTLTTRMPNTVVPARKGNYGIVYPQASYWSVRSVLGKVLAPLTDARGSRMKCLGGFVGPCLSPSLPESTFGLMLELQARQVISDMEETNLDGGMARTVMPVVESKQGKAADWVEPMPPPMSTDSVKLQTLRLGKVATDPVTTGTVATGDRKPPRYTARLDFWLAKSKTMATMTLRSNSIFMAAPPCRGTHRIDPHEASQYTFQVLEIRDLPRAEPGAGMGNAAVIVINATSGEAAHTFARAWCSHRARNAVVWKSEGGRCCFKCALMLAGKIGVATGILIVG
ncbi:hypothetical protein NW754_004188 [Fusarium falciforme]|nr:hypothetical protein NW754_004188 [Fusarium falciforme]